MKFDPTELRSIQDTLGAGRLDLYVPIHKALRAWMASLVCQLGSMDTADPVDTRQTLDELNALLDVLEGHLETENALVHPVIEAKHPGAVAEVESDHEGHREAIARLRGHSLAVAGASGTEREVAALFLYREFALFTAENFDHMQVEESVNQRLLWESYSDEELGAIHQAILQSIEPAKMGEIMRWMLPANPHATRVEMLAGMRDAMPAPAFQGMLDIAQARLTLRDWTKLTLALGLPQEAGLAELAG